MYKYQLILCVLIFSLNAAAAKPQLSVNLNQYGANTESETRQSSLWGAAGIWKFLYSPTAYFTEDIALATTLETGSFRSRYTENGKPSSGLSLIEAKITFLPNDFFKMSAGAHSMNYFSAPMLFSNKSFAAIKEELTIPIDTLNWQIFSMQAIPKSDSSDLGLINLGPRDSYLLVTGSRLDAPGNIFSMGISYFYFHFSKLFNAVAYESQFDGNSVSGIGLNNTAFDYQYQGHHAALSWEIFKSSPISWKQNFSYLFNQQAPNRYNSGLMLENIFKVYDWCVNATLFKIRRDAAVAYYNTSSLGNTNRDGFLFEISTLTPQIGGEMAMKYVKSNTIEKNSYQSDEQRVEFNWSQNFNLF